MLHWTELMESVLSHGSACNKWFLCYPYILKFHYVRKMLLRWMSLLNRTIWQVEDWHIDSPYYPLCNALPSKINHIYPLTCFVWITLTVERKWESMHSLSVVEDRESLVNDAGVLFHGARLFSRCCFLDSVFFFVKLLSVKIAQWSFTLNKQNYLFSFKHISYHYLVSCLNIIKPLSCFIAFVKPLSCLIAFVDFIELFAVLWWIDLEETVWGSCYMSRIESVLWTI